MDFLKQFLKLNKASGSSPAEEKYPEAELGRQRREDRDPGRKVRSWYDVHSHFLPGIDDGCADVGESLMLLNYCRKKGIAGIIATPHYYPTEPVDRFIERRKAADEKLRIALSQNNIKVPEWCLGAETAYHTGLVRNEDIEKLCLGKSRYLLLELPFEKWGNSVLQDIHELLYVKNIIPIIAHLERYLKIQNKDVIARILETDALIQMNGEFVLDGRQFREAKRRIGNGLVDVLGSDAHNMKYRKPNLRETVDKLETSGIVNSLEKIRMNNREVFMQAMGKSI